MTSNMTSNASEGFMCFMEIEKESTETVGISSTIFIASNIFSYVRHYKYYTGNRWKNFAIN